MAPKQKQAASSPATETKPRLSRSAIRKAERLAEEAAQAQANAKFLESFQRNKSQYWTTLFSKALRMSLILQTHPDFAGAHFGRVPFERLKFVRETGNSWWFERFSVDPVAETFSVYGLPQGHTVQESTLTAPLYRELATDLEIGWAAIAGRLEELEAQRKAEERRAEAARSAVAKLTAEELEAVVKLTPEELRAAGLSHLA